MTVSPAALDQRREAAAAGGARGRAAGDPSRQVGAETKPQESDAADVLPASGRGMLTLGLLGGC